MLILTRKSGESIVVGENITLTILEVKGSQVKVGIEAPEHVRIHRLEVYERIREENLSASHVQPADLGGLEDFLSLRKE